MWQVMQLPAATGPVVPVWLMMAGAKAVKFLWQTSHCAVVRMWMEAGLPSALVPLWHVEQIPVAGGLAVAWLKVPVAQVVVELWQVLHCAVVAMCVSVFFCAFWAT